MLLCQAAAVEQSRAAATKVINPATQCCRFPVIHPIDQPTPEAPLNALCADSLLLVRTLLWQACVSIQPYLRAGWYVLGGCWSRCSTTSALDCHALWPAAAVCQGLVHHSP